MPQARRWRGSTLEQGPHTWGPYAAAVRADAPQRYYRLTEIAGSSVAIDNSGNESNSTVFSNVTLGQQGAMPYESTTCGLFNGTSSDIEFAGPSVQGGTATMELWIHSATAWPSGTITALTFRADVSHYHSINVINGAVTATFYINGAQLTTSSYIINVGNWHHIVANWDGTFLNLYIDNVLKESNNSASGALTGTSTGTSNIGNNAGSSNFFAGNIQDVAIYNTALSSTRVAAHYSAANLLNSPVQPTRSRRFTPGHSFTRRGRSSIVPSTLPPAPPVSNKKLASNRLPWRTRKSHITPPWVGAGVPWSPPNSYASGQRRTSRPLPPRRGKQWNVPWFQANPLTNGYTLPNTEPRLLRVFNRYWLRRGRNWTPPYVPSIPATGTWFPEFLKRRPVAKIAPRRAKTWAPVWESFSLLASTVNYAQGTIVVQLVGQGTAWQTGITIFNIVPSGVGFTSQNIVINSPTSATWTINFDTTTGTSGSVSINDSLATNILQVAAPSFLYGVLRKLSEQRFTYTRKTKTWDPPRESWYFSPNVINYSGSTFVVQLVGSGTQWDATRTNWNIVASNLGLASSSFVINSSNSVTWTFTLSQIFPGSFQVDDGISGALLTVLDQVMLWSKIGKPPVGYKQWGRRGKQWNVPWFQAFASNPAIVFTDKQFRVHRTWLRRGRVWSPYLAQQFGGNPSITFQNKQFRIHRVYTHRGKVWSPFLPQAYGTNPAITFQDRQFRIHRVYTRRGRSWAPYLPQAYATNPNFITPNFHPFRIPWLGQWRRKGKLWEQVWPPQQMLPNPTYIYQNRPPRIHRFWLHKGKSWEPFLIQAYPPNPAYAPIVNSRTTRITRSWQRRGKLWVPFSRSYDIVYNKRRPYNNANLTYSRRSKLWNPNLSQAYGPNPIITEFQGRRAYPRNYAYNRQHKLWMPVQILPYTINPIVTDYLGRRSHLKLRNFLYQKRPHIWSPYLPQAYPTNPDVGVGNLHLREIPVRWIAPRRGIHTQFGLGLTIAPAPGPPGLYIATEEVFALYIATEVQL